MANSNDHQTSKRQYAQRQNVANVAGPKAPEASPHGFVEPTSIDVHGARVHNLKDIDVSIPLHRLVGIAGVSGSGKSSLAIGTLYAEGSRRYLEALSTFTRRRLTQASSADVDAIEHVPAAIALHQRPGVPGVRSTFGTQTELLNGLRLLFSRVGSYVCPNGHRVPPSMSVALEKPIVCPKCGAKFSGLSAEDLAFSSQGACPTCGGTGIVRQVDESTLVPDDTKTIDEGAVAPWQQLMWKLMTQIVADMGVRTDVPFKDLTAKEKDIVFHGPAEKHHIYYQNKDGHAGELNFTYFNAVYSVQNALDKVKDERGLKRVSKFLKEGVCPDCHGSRLSKAARTPTIKDINLAEATDMTLEALNGWLSDVPESLPEDVRPMVRQIIASMDSTVQRLLQLGLGYLSLSRASSTLSTGERQRVQMARAVRSHVTGVLYVLDEPTIGLHPSNVDGLMGVVGDLMADGNSVVMVDHDTRVLRRVQHLIEIGSGSGAQGGRVIAQGSVDQVEHDPSSRIAPFLSGERHVRVRTRCSEQDMFDQGTIHMKTAQIHTVHPLDVTIPRGRLTVVTGVSGSGKTTTILESLIPALQAKIEGNPLPGHVTSIDESCQEKPISRVDLIDATPIGVNVRSTVSTYSGVLDGLRRAFAATPDAKKAGYKASDFSYNTGKLRCPTCDGTGSISLDVQFLPDVEIECPDCVGTRYGKDANGIRIAANEANGAGYTIAQVLALTVDQALSQLGNMKGVTRKLQILHDIGLGYLTLGEATPALSGGEAQRLKLASQMTRDQSDALFVFDEPTIGLHPLDVEVLLRVLQHLIEKGATVVVIEHDLDMIANADYLIDMGPGGGTSGGRVVCAGTPEQVCACPESVTGTYLKQEL